MYIAYVRRENEFLVMIRPIHIGNRTTRAPSRGLKFKTQIQKRLLLLGRFGGVRHESILYCDVEILITLNGSLHDSGCTIQKRRERGIVLGYSFCRHLCILRCHIILLFCALILLIVGCRCYSHRHCCSSRR